ncbi:hypothetical protein BDD12DRAFT_849339 [Trichophaea hybrida]|nr:hypothetical protein BDD12DRAFT_849339 [Trichophaea hybrida]
MSNCMSTPALGAIVFWSQLVTGSVCLPLGRLLSQLPIALPLFMGAYIMWILSLLFLIINMAKDKTPQKFARMSLPHMVCVGLVMAFLGQVMGFRPEDLHVYLPLCTNIGITMSVGIQSWFDVLTNGTVTSRRWMQRMMLPPLDPILPTYNNPIVPNQDHRLMIEG